MPRRHWSLSSSIIKLEMEIEVARDLLHRTLDAAHARDMVAVSDFRKELEFFVRSEIHTFPQVEGPGVCRNQEVGEENVATGKSYPKSFLFPRSVRNPSNGIRNVRLLVSR